MTISNDHIANAAKIRYEPQQANQNSEQWEDADPRATEQLISPMQRAVQ